MTTAEKLTQIARNQPRIFDAGVAKGLSESDYGEGYAAGQQAEYDRFWNAVFDSLKGNFNNAFASTAWNDETYNPNAPIICTNGSAANLFNNARMTDIKVPVEVRVANANYLFTGCSNLRRIPSLGFFGVTSNSSIFTSCTSLEQVIFDGELQVSVSFASCAKLTEESMQSVIDHLKDLTGQTTQKLTFHATAAGKLTDAQKAAITAKNWTLVY